MRLPRRRSPLASVNAALGVGPSVKDAVQRQVGARTGFTTVGDDMIASPFGRRWSVAVHGRRVATGLQRGPEGQLRARHSPGSAADTEAALVPDRRFENAVVCPVPLVEGAASGRITTSEPGPTAAPRPRARRAGQASADLAGRQTKPAGIAAPPHG